MTTGPPAVKPNWFCRSSPLGTPPAFSKKSAASSLSLRKNSQAAPWKLLVPDLIVALRTAAPERPNSALQYDEVRAVQEVHCVGVVVDAVQQVVVLRRAVAIGGESAAGGVTTRVSLRRVHAGSQLR